MKIQYVKDNLKHTGLKEIIYYSQLHSTNTYAKENNIESDTLIVTPYQYEGRGRFDRIWESIEGNNLTFTIVKNINIDASKIFIINFYVSYIVLKAIKDFFPDYMQDNFTLKWPNDLLIKNKKFGGILSEVKNINDAEKKFIIGVGIDVNQNEFSDNLSNKATSLRIETGIIFELEELLIRIIDEFYTNFELLKDTKKVIELWKSNSKIFNKEIKFRQTDDNKEIIGKIVDVLDDGSIKIETVNKFNTNKEYFTYYSGEISFIF